MGASSANIAARYMSANSDATLTDAIERLRFSGPMGNTHFVSVRFNTRGIWTCEPNNRQIMGVYRGSPSPMSRHDQDDDYGDESEYRREREMRDHEELNKDGWDKDYATPLSIAVTKALVRARLDQDLVVVEVKEYGQVVIEQV